jgi:hypothetical protein
LNLCSACACPRNLSWLVPAPLAVAIDCSTASSRDSLVFAVLHEEQAITPIMARQCDSRGRMRQGSLILVNGWQPYRRCAETHIWLFHVKRVKDSLTLSFSRGKMRRCR